MIRGTRGILLVAGILVGLVVAAIPLGRWERAGAIRAQQQKIERIARLAPHGIGPRGLGAFRLSTTFDCLLYRVGPNAYAVELCFDGNGRLIEAIDRRNEASLRIGSLRYDPAAAPIVVPVPRLVRLFRGIKGLKIDDRLPLGLPDTGPLLYRTSCIHCLATG